MYLNCHSTFSFKFGTLPIKSLLALAAEHEVQKLALTDINNTSGSLEWMREAPKYGVQPVLGIDFRNGVIPKFIGIAQTQHGYAALNRYLSAHLHAKETFPDRAPLLEDVFFIYPFDPSIPVPLLADHEYMGVRPWQLNQLQVSAWLGYPEKLVALNTVTVQSKKDYNAHRLLRAIDNNTLLSKLPESETGSLDDRMFSQTEIDKLFREYPFLVENATKLLERCGFEFEFKTAKNKKSFYDSPEEDALRIKDLIYQGALFRYGRCDEDIQRRIDKELDIIEKKSFVAYFLINWDIVRYAREQGFFYVGRGSGANSIIAYCLRITDVDPIGLDLYFERFINLFRENPPDFDIDFSWKDRDDIIRYIFNKYGADHTCLLGTYNTFQMNSVVREIGKVFGLPKAEIEELIVGYKNGLPAPTRLGNQVYRYAEHLKDFPSHLSIHAGGILISEEPIYAYTATDLPPKDFPVSHFSMIEAEDIGLNKFDILSQRGLGHIKEAVEIIRKNCGIEVDIYQLDAFKRDPLIAAHLGSGNTVGCFYVESPAMRMLLSKLAVVDYLGLVAASSIIRPGVAQSGMMRQYILLHRKSPLALEVHPIMKEIMPDTYGVMVYQEDVIKVAHQFAGVSLSEADVLRRGMSGKYRSREEFKRVEERYFEECKKKGHSDGLAREVWRQIESFAGYSFAKGHSASFAVESYQSLHLKAYYPLEFMVGVINNFGGFYSTALYVHEARKCGALIEAPCINRSDRLTSIDDVTVHLGFIHIDQLEQQVVQTLLAERETNGPFADFDDFLGRVSISLEQLLLLIRIAAFRFTGKSKQQLLWEAHFILSKSKKVNTDEELFYYRRSRTFNLPELHHDFREDMLDELDLLGFTIDSPFLLLADATIAGIKAIDMCGHLNQSVQMVGYLVTVKPTRTIKGETMYFGTFIDENGGWIDTVHFPPVAKKHPFRKSGCYLLRGKITEEFGFYSLEVTYMDKLPYWNREGVY